MSIRLFRCVRFDNDWELNFIGRRWNLRIGRSQLALFKDYVPVFSWVAARYR